MEDYSRFQTIYANLPETIRRSIVVIVDEKPYSWNAVYIELKGQTKLGKAMYKQLIKLGII